MTFRIISSRHPLPLDVNIKVMSTAPTTETRSGYCKCGCGLKTLPYRRNYEGAKIGTPMPYLRGHYQVGDPYKAKFLKHHIQTTLYLEPADRKKIDFLKKRLGIKSLSELVRELVRSAVEGMR